jgi:hypothetical protein
MRFMRGLLWLKLRREHPELTLDDFRTLDLKTIAEALVRPEDEAPDPTGGGEHPPTPTGEPKPTTSPTSATSGA